jgi:hypothetical protein
MSSIHAAFVLTVLLPEGNTAGMRFYKCQKSQDKLRKMRAWCKEIPFFFQFQNFFLSFSSLQPGIVAKYGESLGWRGVICRTQNLHQIIKEN